VFCVPDLHTCNSFHHLGLSEEYKTTNFKHARKTIWENRLWDWSCPSLIPFVHPCVRPSLCPNEVNTDTLEDFFFSNFVIEIFCKLVRIFYVSQNKVSEQELYEYEALGAFRVIYGRLGVQWNIVLTINEVSQIDTTEWK